MQQCPTMGRRTLTMNWDGLGEIEDDDSFFESRDRISSVVPLDLLSDDDEDDDFEDSRMSFVSTVSMASMHPTQNNPMDQHVAKSNPLVGYDMWMAEPGDIRERRKRLLQGMGLASTKDMLRLASAKIVRAVSRKEEQTPKISTTMRFDTSALTSKVDSSSPSPSPCNESHHHHHRHHSNNQSRKDGTRNPSPSHSSHSTAIVLVRSRSDGDIDQFSAQAKQRREELVGPVSKERLTRTLSGVCSSQYNNGVRVSQERGKKNNLVGLNSEILTDNHGLGSLFVIKNLDTGKEFIVKENKLSDVQTGKLLTMEEFEKSVVGYSPVVKELMRRQNQVGNNHHMDSRKMNNHNSYFTRSFRNSKRKGAAFLKNIKGVATSMSGINREQQDNHSSPKKRDLSPVVEDSKTTKAASQWIKARQHGKSYREFTALHMSQEIQAHEGSIWTIKFSLDAHFLASAGEDKTIHVWEVQECEVASARTSDDLCSTNRTPVHPMAGITSARPEITTLLSEKKKRGKSNRKKGNIIPDYVNVPETVFALSEKPICSFKGHQDDVLDISWSRSQLLLSSSMDKTVRMWDLETRSCLKMFAHNDYVTCIQFNPVDENYFMSGSLDAKVRIWSIPDRQVVDWTDVHEMVTAASYTPDAQGAIIGSHQGICRFYDIDDSKLEYQNEIQMKTKSQAKKLPGFQSQAQIKKVTGFQFAPWNTSEVLISCTDSRIRIYNGANLVQKFRGFRNTSSQSSASFSPDGKHVISASEDSQVYIWKVEETKNLGPGRKRTRVTIQAHEHFPSKDVCVAIPWPGSTKNEAPIVEIHSKRHSKRSTLPLPPNSGGGSSSSPTTEDNQAFGASGRRNLPPLPKKNNGGLERITSSGDEDFVNSGHMDPGIGETDSFGSSSTSIRYNDSPMISASANSPSQSWSSSRNLLDSNGGGGGSHGGQILQATAWGLVIVTASLEGEIRVYQNFGLPRKVRQAHIFRD